MIKIRYLLFCKQIIIDETSKQSTVINILEEVSAPKFPAILYESSLSTLFTRDTEGDKNTFDAEYVAELNDTPIGGAKLKLNFSQKKRNRCIIKFPPMPLSEAGILKFTVFIDKKVIGTLEIDVVLRQV